ARVALARATPLERRLYSALSSGDEGLEDWIRWHDELAQTVDSPEVELERFILLGEAKQTDALREGLEQWDRPGDEVAHMKHWLAAAYLMPALDRSTARTLITEVRHSLPAGWFADTLVAHMAERAGDAVSRAQAESAMVTRGTALLGRWRALEAGGLVVGLTGLAGPAAHTLPKLAWVSITLVGVAIAGETVASFALDTLHLSAHWADGLQENLIWGSWGTVARETVDAVFWAPFAEEIGFRGVLYPALRTRWGAGAAAAASAAL